MIDTQAPSALDGVACCWKDCEHAATALRASPLVESRIPVCDVHVRLSALERLTALSESIRLNEDERQDMRMLLSTLANVQRFIGLVPQIWPEELGLAFISMRASTRALEKR